MVEKVPGRYAQYTQATQHISEEEEVIRESALLCNYSHVVAFTIRTVSSVK